VTTYKTQTNLEKYKHQNQSGHDKYPYISCAFIDHYIESFTEKGDYVISTVEGFTEKGDYVTSTVEGFTEKGDYVTSTVEGFTEKGDYVTWRNINIRINLVMTNIRTFLVHLLIIILNGSILFQNQRIAQKLNKQTL
jgi:hypothetical protein